MHCLGARCSVQLALLLGFFGMSTAEINAACKAVCNSLLKTNTKLAGYIWESSR